MDSAVRPRLTFLQHHEDFLEELSSSYGGILVKRLVERWTSDWLIFLKGNPRQDSDR